ncbi:hypothetical protein Bbad01_40490 [Bacillus badius]|nr:hypothetical protein Bbad01_40490 [Bacillus badius]
MGNADLQLKKNKKEQSFSHSLAEGPFSVCQSRAAGKVLRRTPFDSWFVSRTQREETGVEISHPSDPQFMI